MPGRRFPPQSPEARGAQHRRAAFEGALDGMSYLPSPIKQNPPGTVHGRYLMQFGQDEKVVTSWGRQEVPLSNKATPYSEHVFVCGPLYGRALREGVEWERFSDFQGVTVLDTAGVQPGDVIVVEYARFGGGSAVSDKCDQTYPGIVASGASALTRIGTSNSYLPSPAGFPTEIVDGDYWGPSTWFADWMTAYGGISGSALATTAVPGIAPGSAYARETRRTTTGRIPGVSHVIMLYSGDLRPRWSQATRVGGESWFRQVDALPTEFESDFIQYIYWYTASSRYRVWVSVGYHHKDRNWYVELNRTGPALEGISTYFRHLLTGWTGIPHDGAVHRMGYDIDCATQTITAFFDSQKFVYTGGPVWPSAEALALEVYADESRSDWVGYSFESAIGAQTAKALITDGHTIRTDVPYCKWETRSTAKDIDCGLHALDVVLKGAPDYTLMPYPYSTERHWLPFAEGFPKRVATGGSYEGYTDLSNWFAVHRTGGSNTTTTSVPGIAPGSQYARRTSFTSGGSNVHHMMRYRTGDLAPRWSTATKFSQDVWYQLENPTTKTDRDLWLETDGKFSLTGGSSNVVWLIVGVDYRRGRLPSNPWTLNAFFTYPDGTDHYIYTPIPNFGDPFANGSHHLSWSLDCASRVFTAQFDGQTFTHTHTDYWPDASIFVNEKCDPGVGDFDYSGYYQTFQIDSASAYIIDNWRTSSDIEFCKW